MGIYPYKTLPYNDLPTVFKTTDSDGQNGAGACLILIYSIRDNLSIDKVRKVKKN